MPAYTNIESYHKTNGEDDRSILNRFRMVLEGMGCWNSTVAQSFQRFMLEVDEWGQIEYEFPWIKAIPVQGFEPNAAVVPISPFVSVDGCLGADGELEIWIGCGFWIESSLLEDYSHYRFAPDAFQFLMSLMYRLAKELPDHPIYLTNELNDGKPREFIVGNRESAKWEFDFALVPQAYLLQFSDLPATHTANMNGGMLEISNIRLCPTR